MDYNNDIDSQSTAESIDLTNTTQDSYTDNISSQFRNDMDIIDSYGTHIESDDQSLNLTLSNNDNANNNNMENKNDSYISNPLDDLVTDSISEEALIAMGIDINEIRAQKEIEKRLEMEAQQLEYAKQVQEELNREAQLQIENNSNSNNNNTSTFASSSSFPSSSSSPSIFNNNSTTTTTTTATNSTSTNYANNNNDTTHNNNIYFSQDLSTLDSQQQPTINSFLKGKRSINSLENTTDHFKRPKIDISNNNFMNQQYKGESSSSSSSSSSSTAAAAAAAASSTSNNNNNNGNLNVFVIDSDEEPQFVDLTQEQNDYYNIDSDHSNYIDEENYEDPNDNIISSQNLSKLQHQLTLLLNQNDSNKRYGLSRNTKNYIDLDDLDFFNNNYNNSKPFQYNRNPISNSISSSIYRGSNNAILTEGQAREQLRKLLESINDDVPPPESRVGTPDGLVVNLLEHQKIGFQWMTKQEESINKGGMLTDDMGLGKTIQALSIIVSRKCQEMDEVPDVISAAMRRRAKQPEKTFKIKATLVICPVSLMEQWAQEIKTKTENISVYIHHGANRIHNTYELAKFDVIITSYNIISMEFNDNEILAGPLKKVKVHRIILDEAHTIKNRNTRAAMGCCQIEADYRWCLTATPIQNNIDELYSLIKFLQIKPYNDWNIFRDEISKKVKAGDPNVCTKIQLILKAISLRRTKKAQIDGRPILNLPERNVHFTHVEFPPEEREFYNYVNTGVMKKFDEYVRNGTVMKHYSSILVLLLRLRQACLHPSLTSIEKPEKIDDTENQEKCAMSLDSKVVDRLLSSKYELETSECPICMDAADNPQIIAQCGHIMCKECISNYMNSGGNYGGPKTCPQCRGELDPKALLSVEIFFKIHAPELHKSEEEIEVKPESLLEGLAAVQDFISSKKIDTMLEILKKTEKDTHGQDKTIVFSQFTSMLDIMEKPLKMNGIKFGRYDGSMPIGNRTKMIDAFYNDPDMKVLLVSTKCGSLGLNLTMANRVIMMDVWWNPALENQAIDRVHRIGQTKDVEVHRIFIKDTVEDRILELQRKKQELADSALGEGKTQKLGRLGMEEMLYLFHGGSAPTVAQIGQGI